MTAEAIARVMRDFRRKNVRYADEEYTHAGNDALVRYIAEAEVINIQPIHAEAKRTGWRMYEDSVCRPPLLNAAYAWENDFGNVVVWHAVSMHRSEDLFDGNRWESEADDHDIDWELVEWVSACVLWVGGYSTTNERHIPTTGPVAIVTLAINADGVVQDVHWRIGVPYWTEETLLDDTSILLRALTFLNCRNVVVTTPTRPRAERKRIERIGVTVSEIHIQPMGSYAKRLGHKNPVPLSAAGPLSNVRGHVARYGPRWGRGLLFGKYECEIWVPQHARGSADEGVIRHDYLIEEA